MGTLTYEGEILLNDLLPPPPPPPPSSATRRWSPIRRRTGSSGSGSSGSGGGSSSSSSSSSTMMMEEFGNASMVSLMDEFGNQSLASIYENECDADAADAIFDTSKHTNYGNDYSQSTLSWWDDCDTEDEDNSADVHNAAPAEMMTKEQKNLQRWSPQIRESKKTSSNVVRTKKSAASTLDTTTHHTVRVRIDAMLAPPVRRCSIDNELRLLNITKDICDDDWSDSDDDDSESECSILSD